jgi:DNA-binding NarL/FixJ family response regulator
MERRRREDMEQNGDSGREPDPQRSGSTPDGSHSTEEHWSTPANPKGATTERDGASWINWQSALYIFVLGAISLVLVPLTSLWWIVPLLGAAVPITLAVLDRPTLASSKRDDKKTKEQELLEVLAERGELTPTTAAMRTSLTVDEASKTLEELAHKGHLKLEVEEGVMAYALRERDREKMKAPDSRLPEAGVVDESPEQTRASQTLEDPLSERELEVLALLASGRTNSEIASSLFVSVGTIKSHTGNIYRKLEAKNRTEALARARELGLIR